MRFTVLLPIFATLLACTCFAAADDDEPVCKPDGNQMEMNACAARDYKAADAALNTQYKQLMDSLAPAAQDKLRTSQRAWLKQRDPACKAKSKANEGGSIWPLVFYGCLETATKKRTKVLAQWPKGT